MSQYIAPGSELEINLPATISQPLHDMFRGRDEAVLPSDVKIDSKVFVEAKLEIRDLLQINMLHRFKASHYHTQLLQIVAQRQGSVETVSQTAHTHTHAGTASGVGQSALFTRSRSHPGFPGPGPASAAANLQLTNIPEQHEPARASEGSPAPETRHTLLATAASLPGTADL